MIEKKVLDFLSEKLSVPVAMEVINGTDSFVVIEKTGGAEENYIYSAVIAVQSYGPTLYEAAELNEKVKNAMREIENLDSVSKCKLNSDYNFTDTETKRYRYQAVFDLVHY